MGARAQGWKGERNGRKRLFCVERDGAGDLSPSGAAERRLVPGMNLLFLGLLGRAEEMWDGCREGSGPCFIACNSFTGFSLVLVPDRRLAERWYTCAVAP